MRVSSIRASPLAEEMPADRMPLLLPDAGDSLNVKRADCCGTCGCGELTASLKLYFEK